MNLEEKCRLFNLCDNFLVHIIENANLGMSAPRQNFPSTKYKGGGVFATSQLNFIWKKDLLQMIHLLS